MRGKIHLIGIALKNLSRHRVKTVLTIAAIAIGVGLFNWMDCWLLGMNIDSKRNLVNYETGAAKIYSKAYFAKKDELPMYESFKDYEPIIERLDELGYDAAPHSVFVGSLISESEEQPFKFIGVDPEKEKVLFNYYQYLEPNNRLSRDDFENVILPKADKEQQKLLKSVYSYDSDDGYYHLHEVSYEGDEKLKKLEEAALKERQKMDELQKDADSVDEEVILKNPRINKMLNKQQLKQKTADRAVSSRKRKLKRDYLDSIKAVFRDVGYYKFLDNNTFEAVLGAKGAERLNVEVGDKVRCSVIIDIKDEMGRVRHVNQLIDLRVSGTINSPNPMTNANVAYLPLSILQDEMGLMLEWAITEISIRKKDAPDHKLPGADEKAEHIIGLLGDDLPNHLTLVGWREDAKDYLAVSAGDVVSTYIMMGILFILASMGIANTMLMAVLERTKEIGMLRSLGMRDGDVMTLLLMEAALLGFFGSLIGILLALPADYMTIYYGIDYTNIIEDMSVDNIGYRVVGIFKGAWNPVIIILSPIVATLISVVVSFAAAIKAVKMSITDALRFE